MVGQSLAVFVDDSRNCVVIFYESLFLLTTLMKLVLFLLFSVGCCCIIAYLNICTNIYISCANFYNNNIIMTITIIIIIE